MSTGIKANRGAVYVFITGLLFSLGGLCMKVVPWNAMAINAFRCLASAAVVLIYMRIAGRKLRFNRTVAVCAAAICATTTVYAAAVKLTTAGAAIVIQFTAPVWTMILGALIFRKKPRRIDVAACAFVFAGIAVCFFDGLAAGRTLGNLLALLSGMTYSGVFMCNSAKDSHPMSSVVYGQFASALIGLPWLLRAPFGELDAGAWTALVVLGVFQLGLGYVFLAAGLETTPPVTACLLTGIEPVLNPVWVALFYKETVTPLFIAGGALVLLSVTVYGVLDARRSEACAERRAGAA